METNPYKPPTASLAVDNAPNDELNTRELYNKVLIFRGRMGRIRYLYTTVAGLAMALIMIMFWGRLSPFLMVPATIYYGVKVPWVFAASSVRRVQDLGKPAVWAWFALLPPMFIWLAIAPGESEANGYGKQVFKPTKWEYTGVVSSLFLAGIFLLVFAY